jgi:hypothetical protein
MITNRPMRARVMVKGAASASVPDSVPGVAGRCDSDGACIAVPFLCLILRISHQR